MIHIMYYSVMIYIMYYSIMIYIMYYSVMICIMYYSIMIYIMYYSVIIYIMTCTQTLFDGSRSLPSFCQVTVGAGAPEIGTGRVSGSPAFTRISLLPSKSLRSNLGAAEISERN